MILREVKSNPYKVLRTFAVNTKNNVELKGSIINDIKLTDLPIADRYSTGSQISKEKLTDAFVTADFESKKELVENVTVEDFTEEILKEVPKVELKKEAPAPQLREKTKEEINLKEIDDKLLTIEDFLNSD